MNFTVRPGIVTGFLGPNGAGKSTTMRMILGLDRPSAGRATVNGRPFREHRAPLQEMGALLEATATELAGMASERGVRVRSPQAAELRDLLLAAGAETTTTGPDVLEVTGLTADEIGARAWVANMRLQELTPLQASLQETFMELTHDAVEYHGSAGTAGTADADRELVTTGGIAA